MAITDNTATIDYVDSGDGPAVLFLPGSFSTPAAWRGIQKRLPPGYRFVATSLPGYGASAETRARGDLDMAHEVRVVAEAARRVGAPVHLVGHSFGATVALAAALSAPLGGALEVRSIATFEANPIDVLRGGARADLHAATRRMQAALEADCAAGAPDAAGRVIDFWGGAGAFAAMPEAVRDYCRATVGANLLDWHTCFDFQPGEAAWRALDVPVLLARGGRANDQMIAITDTLARWLPDARTAVVEGANHFLITSHAEDCARLLGAFLDAQG